jgi:hypothetical protein
MAARSLHSPARRWGVPRQTLHGTEAAKRFCIPDLAGWCGVVCTDTRWHAPPDPFFDLNLEKSHEDGDRDHQAVQA